MLATAYEKMDGHYGRRAIVNELGGEALIRAKDIFNDYKTRGIIVSGDFKGPGWVLSNQVKRVGLTLISFEGAFNKNAMEWLGCDYLCFQDSVKAFILFKLGEMNLMSLQELARAITGLAGKTMDEAAKSAKTAGNAMRIAEFLENLPGGCDGRDFVIEALEEKAEQYRGRCGGKQRRLADFNSYLRFSEILTGFWQGADKKQKLFYFPLYFWWNLTSILPLRPTEFLLIPRGCLDTSDSGEHILTVRRTKLKGGFERHSYSIEGDYERKRYIISDALANELLAYLAATNGMGMTEIGTLFLREPHFSYTNAPERPCRYYTYNCLKTCMRCFRDETAPDGHGELPVLHFGDTRHLAMASLIISGGSPVICKELAGHSSIDISSHYYSNISNLVECVTLAKHRKSKGAAAGLTVSQRFLASVPGRRYKVAGGWCDEPSVANGGISECLKAGAGDGHIGDRAYCRHYIPDDPGVRLEMFSEKNGKQQVDDDCAYLMRMVELVRKGLGYPEDINAALLRLQHSGSLYGELLMEKYRKAETSNGKAEETWDR